MTSIVSEAVAWGAPQQKHEYQQLDGEGANILSARANSSKPSKHQQQQPPSGHGATGPLPENPRASTNAVKNYNMRASEERILHLRNEIARKSASILQLQQLARELPRLAPGASGSGANSGLAGTPPQPTSRPYPASATASPSSSSFYLSTMSHSLPSLNVNTFPSSPVQEGSQDWLAPAEAGGAPSGTVSSASSSLTMSTISEGSSDSSVSSGEGLSGRAFHRGLPSRGSPASQHQHRYAGSNSSSGGSSSSVEEEEKDSKPGLSQQGATLVHSSSGQQRRRTSRRHTRPLSLQPNATPNFFFSDPATTSSAPAMTMPMSMPSPNGTTTVPQLTNRSSHVLISPTQSPTTLVPNLASNSAANPQQPLHRSPPLSSSHSPPSPSPSVYSVPTAITTNSVASTPATAPSHTPLTVNTSIPYNSTATSYPSPHRYSLAAARPPSAIYKNSYRSVSATNPSTPSSSSSSSKMVPPTSTTTYLHMKTPSSYDTHPSRTNWKTTSHVIENLQCTIDSLRRELAEQRARVDEERSVKDAFKKKVQQLESQMDAYRHQAETLNSIFERKERRGKELERQVDEYKYAVARMEGEQSAIAKQKRESDEALRCAVEDKVRAEAMYAALGASVKRNKEVYEGRMDKIGEQLRALCGNNSESDPAKSLETLKKQQKSEEERIAGLKRELAEQQAQHAREIASVVAAAQTQVVESERLLEAKIQETLALVRSVQVTKTNLLLQEQPN